MIRRRRWTPEELEDLRKFVGLGYDAPTIGRWLGRTALAVNHRLISEGIVREKPWTRPEERRLLDMRAASTPYARIARELGRTVAACKLRWSLLNRRAA